MQFSTSFKRIGVGSSLLMSNNVIGPFEEMCKPNSSNLLGPSIWKLRKTPRRERQREGSASVVRGMDEEGKLLCEAAKSGDSTKVKSLIESGADISYFDDEGLNPLMHGAKQGHHDVVKLLLEAGAPWNALSPSNLSAGDFAMDSGHQEAFELLLNAGIQAELVLGTIARAASKNVDTDGNYLEDRVSFSEDKLMDSNSKAVMMAWEKPLMEAHAKAVCSGGGHILNVGFGMGLVDTAIQQYSPVTHTIIEAHQEVYDRMIHTGWGEKENVKIVFGRWQDVLPQLGSYDGIFFDTYGEYYEDLREFHQHLPTLLKPGGIYSFFNGLCGANDACKYRRKHQKRTNKEKSSHFEETILFENRLLNNSPCREAQRGERSIKSLTTVTAVDELITDHSVNDHHHEKNLNVPCWIPHPRTGIYYPKGQERVMDVVPNGAASFHLTYWLRSVDGVEDKPSPDSDAWLHDHPLLICHNNMY